MRVKIYQINSERDIHKVNFSALEYLKQLQGSEKVDASICDEVFDGELDTANPEMIFRKFNQEGHPLLRGHSLSVSDVLLVEGRVYFCQPVGFEQVEFDTSLTQKPDNLIKTVYVLSLIHI